VTGGRDSIRACNPARRDGRGTNYVHNLPIMVAGLGRSE